MHRLESDGALDRALVLLPNDDELVERRQTGRGLTRPEMAVLLAVTKNRIYEQVLASDVVDEAYLESDLQKYFPRRLRRRFADGIRRHGLRREIVATWLTNSMINRGLDVFVDQLTESTGRDVADIARAYVITRDAFALVPLWTALEGLERCDATQQIDFLKRTRRVTLDGTAWFLAHLPARTAMADAVGRFRAGIDEVVGVLPETLTGESVEHLRRELDAFAHAGLDAESAHRLAALPYCMAACDIVEVAGEADASIRGAAATYFTIDAALSLGRIRRWLETVAIRDRWDRLAAAGLADDLYRELRRLSLIVLAEAGDDAPAERVQRWVDANRRILPRLERLFADIDSAAVVDLSMIAVAIRALGDLGKR
jgi:glutamate dehydrogenase